MSKAAITFAGNGGTGAIKGTQNPDGALTAKQRKFVHLLVHEQMSQTAAARLAGYESSTASNAAANLMRNPKVMALIADEREAYAIASGITKKKIVDGFLEAIEMAKMKAEPLTMVAGWREIGKMCGHYEPTRSEIRVSVNGQVMLHKLQNMSDEELLKQVEQFETIEGDFDVVDPPAEDGENPD
jgi:hypothetical protein